MKPINPNKLHGDIPWNMPQELYFTQVSFNGDLEHELNQEAIRGDLRVWDFNARQHFIMQKDSFRESIWFAPFSRVGNAGEGYTLQFNFGDLLKLPTHIILLWEKYFIATDTELDNAKKILFPKTDDDAKFVQEYWEGKTKEWSGK